MADNPVPPLEDMSELLQQVEALKEIRCFSAGRVPVAISSQLNNASMAMRPNNIRDTSSQGVEVSGGGAMGGATGGLDVNNISTTASVAAGCNIAQPRDNRSFAGMKKGFLDNMATNLRDNDKRTNETRNLRDANMVGCSKKTYNKDMPFIKGKHTEGRSGGGLTEDLENREKQNIFHSTDRVTDDLLKKIQMNPTLAKRLSDPNFVQAITEFQANPQAAMAKYQNNLELQKSMQEFCAILGDHFLKMNAKQESAQKPTNIGTVVNNIGAESGALSAKSTTRAGQSVQDDDRKVRELLSDPEIREALMDKKIQELIQLLKRNPERAQSLLQQGDSEMRKKVRKLVDAGLLSFQT